MDSGKNNNIAILLACYNGQEYIEEQIKSILSQSYSDFSLYIHDDDSKDSTVSIVRDLALNDRRIHLLDYSREGRGAMDNFFSLLKRVDSDYYMFADQDDVWKETKIEKSLLSMKEEEGKHPDKPVVVCTDLIVTDSNLNVIHDSYWKHAGIYPDYFTDFNKFAASSVSTGCTMLFNEKAKTAASRRPDKAIMHDAWVTLCTIRDGGILKCLPEAQIYYRQHGDNTLGASGTSAQSFDIFYRIRHMRKMFLQNKGQYEMLRALGYPSLFEYIKNKIAYKKWIKNHEE